MQDCVISSGKVVFFQKSRNLSLLTNNNFYCESSEESEKNYFMLLIRRRHQADDQSHNPGDPKEERRKVHVMNLKEKKENNAHTFGHWKIDNLKIDTRKIDQFIVKIPVTQKRNTA